MSRGEVVKAGYLTKSPPERVSKVAQWHRRWFVLSDSHKVYPLAKRYVRMEYYQSEDDTKRMKNPKGVIDLQQCTMVANRENLKGYKHVFDVCTMERTYHLAADSFTEKHEWIDTLNRTLFSSSHVPSSHSTSPQVQNAEVITRVPQDRSSSPSQERHRRELQRPISYSGDSSALKQSRPLPPVPGDSISNRPLPPTPADTNHLNQPYSVSETRHYKRPPHQPTPRDLPQQYSLPQSLHHPLNSQHSRHAPPHKHVVVRQTKSHSNVPSAYLLTPSPPQPQSADQRDYVNLDNEALPEEPPPRPKPYGGPSRPIHRPSPHSESKDYINLNEALVEEPVSAPVTRQKRAPPKAKSVDYVNWEKPSLLGGDDYSVLKPEPRQASLDQDYSHLELPDLPTERTDVSRNPTGPPPKDKDYENLAHVAHPDEGDYSNLQH